MKEVKTEDFIRRVMNPSQVKNKLRSLYYYRNYLTSIKSEVVNEIIPDIDNKIRQSRVDEIANFIKNEIEVYEHFLKEADEALPII